MEIVIRHDAYNMIRKLAAHEFINVGQRQQNGDWIVSVSDLVFENVVNVMLKGETISDTIIRLGTLYQYKLN